MRHMVREAAPADEVAVLDIQRSAYPEYVEDTSSLQWFPARQLDAPVTGGLRFVVGAEELPSGYAALWRVKEQKYRFDLLVHPSQRGRGIGTALFDSVIGAAVELGARTLQARVRADAADSVAFARRRGFVETHRMTGYQIDLRTFDRAGKVGIPTAISVLTLSEARMNNRRWKQDLIELLIAAQLDWPDPDPDPAGSSPVPLSVFDRMLEPVTRPDAFFIAAHRLQYVGVSCLCSLGTAVHPGFRGRGIATVLHSHVLDRARRDGLARIIRPSANPAMQTVFRKLGYQPGLTEIRMVLKLRLD